MAGLLMLWGVDLRAEEPVAADWQGPVEVVEVLPFAQLRLADGVVVRLAGLLDLASEGEHDAERLAGSVVEWRASEFGADRYGAVLAEVRRVPGGSLQAELLQSGAMVLDGQTVPASRLSAWRQVEAKARLEKLGVWQHLAVEDAQGLDAGTFRFAVIADVVTDVGEAGGFTYLNFGDNWRDDFTIRIPKRLARQMRREGWDFPDIAGKRLAVRGWIFRANGPMIEIITSQQVELLK